MSDADRARYGDPQHETDDVPDPQRRYGDPQHTPESARRDPVPERTAREATRWRVDDPTDAEESSTPAAV